MTFINSESGQPQGRLHRVQVLSQYHQVGVDPGGEGTGWGRTPVTEITDGEEISDQELCFLRKKRWELWHLCRTQGWVIPVGGAPKAGLGRAGI